MNFVWGAIGALGGTAVAVIIFILAARFVARARKGNRGVREARHDPHADPAPGEHGRDRHRDISQ